MKFHRGVSPAWMTLESLPSKATLRLVQQPGGFIVLQGREDTEHLSLLLCSEPQQQPSLHTDAV